LIVGGIYSHVRNPMISGVLFILIGESLVFNSRGLMIWSLLFFIINHIYFIVSEEPGLHKRFGKEYQIYKVNVPRWIPRFKPWKP
jgi:protein-S-isoprenylcysteine O-methyltransferase Ste14